MRNVLWIKPVAFAACMTPTVQLSWALLTDEIGANPVEALLHTSGNWGLSILLVTLAMTPLQQWSGRPEFTRLRRMFGLFSFFYLSLHFGVFLIFDLALSLNQLGEELTQRPYIAIGFACWLLLLPLAVTSTRGWQRRLKRNWKTLHRLVYPAVLLGCTHYLWLVKSDLRLPLIYLGIACLLLLARLNKRSRQTKRKRLNSRPINLRAGSASPPSA